MSDSSAPLSAELNKPDLHAAPAHPTEDTEASASAAWTTLPIEELEELAKVKHAFIGLLHFKKQYREAIIEAEQAQAIYQFLNKPLQELDCWVEKLWLTYQLEGFASTTARSLNEAYSQLTQQGLQQQQNTDTSDVRAKILHYKGLMLYRNGLYGEALRLMREALTFCRWDSLMAAKIYDSLAIYYEATGNFAKSKSLLLQALQIKQVLDLDYEQAITLQTLGRQCLLLEQWTEADTYIQRSLLICTTLQDQKRAASLRNDRIKIAMLQNHLLQAQEQIDEAKALHQEGRLKTDYGDTLLYQTYLYFLKNQLAEAKALLEGEVLPLFQQHTQKKGYGIALRLKGAWHHSQGQGQLAIEAMSEAISVFKEQNRSDELAKTYYERGKIYAAAHQNLLAKDSFMEALKIAERQNLAFLTQPIEDELFRIDITAWQDIVDRRVRHQPLFDNEVNLLQALQVWDGGPSGNKAPASEQEASVTTQATHSLLALLKVGQAISAERELDPLLNIIRRETERALIADRCTLFLFDKDKNELWSRVASGINAIEEIRFPAFMGLAGYVFKTGETLNIPDAYADPRFNKEVDKKTGYRTRNILSMPIRNRLQETIGVFQVLNKKDRAFGKDDEQLLQAIAASAGVAIENAMLSEAQKVTLNSFIITLSSTIDARDPITAGHSERVADFATLIGSTMHLGNKDAEVLKYASLLHDIGKIGIREDVLVKDGRLTIEEYQHIQEHARYTHEILQHIRFERHLSQVPEVAASHHEKMDGTGYFRGLKGDAIPRLGRVLAISDVFDAITSRRHYRNRMPFDRVLKLIRRDAGTHFDPDIVDFLFQVPLYQLLEVLVKERLFKRVSSVAHLIRHIDKNVLLAEFESVLLKETPSHQEHNLVELFSSIYYVMPERATDNF